MKRFGLLIICIQLSLAAALAQPISFFPNTIDNSFMGPGGICMIDIDGDGLKDVIGASIDDNSIACWKNQGGYPLSWTKQLVDDQFGGAIYVQANDLDGDNQTDILGAAYNGHELAWWHNGGGFPLQWTKYVIATDFYRAHEITSADIDLDGDIDVLGVSAALHRISWFENDGNFPIQWTEHVVGSNFTGARSVDAADIDGDGDIDLAGASLDDNEISWWCNEGGIPLQWTKYVVADTFTLSHKVQLIDMDMDGRTDILATSYNAGICWFRNLGGNPVQWSQEFISSLNSAVIAYAADLDNDGDLDVAGTAQGGGIIARWENLGSNTLEWNYKRIEFFGGAWPLDYGDLDNDGDIDLVCGGNSANSIRWYENVLITASEEFVSETYKTDFRCYPLPFENKLNLKFELAQDGCISLKIYNISGSLISSIKEEYLLRGSYQFSWSGTNFTNKEVPPGIYFAQLTAGDHTETIKLVKVK